MSGEAGGEEIRDRGVRNSGKTAAMSARERLGKEPIVARGTGLRSCPSWARTRTLLIQSHSPADQPSLLLFACAFPSNDLRHSPVWLGAAQFRCLLASWHTSGTQNRGSHQPGLVTPPSSEQQLAWSSSGREFLLLTGAFRWGSAHPPVQLRILHAPTVGDRQRFLPPRTKSSGHYRWP